MKISKAITVLEDIIHCVKPGDPPEEHQAVKLGIDALKRLYTIRQLYSPFTQPPLPGETPEDD